MKQNQTRGSALIFILIAIALLGGLTVVLSRTSSNTEETGSAERASVEASSIMAYSNNLKNAIDGMILRGCSETQINFNHANLTGYANPNAPADKSCDVFEIEGGAMQLKYFPDTVRPATVSGSYHVHLVGTTATELLYLYRVSRQTCIAINNSVGIANDGSEGPPSDPLSHATDMIKFAGDYTSLGMNANTMISSVPFQGRRAGCRLNSGSGASSVFEYYHVLRAR